MLKTEVSINLNAKKIYEEIIEIINKYRPKEIAPDDLCTNYYNDDALFPLLKELIALLKDEPNKLDLIFAKLAPYLMELMSPRLLIKLDKAYFNANGEFHKRVKSRIECVLSNKDKIMSRYVSICTIYHFDRLIYLSKHFSPENTYTIARLVAIAASKNSDYDDLVLRYAYEAILACPDQDRAYLDLVKIYCKAIFDLDDIDVIKRSIDWLSKINKNEESFFYIGCSYFEFYMNHNLKENINIAIEIDKKLYDKFINARDISRDTEFYMTYVYYRALLGLSLNDKKMLYASYEMAYHITHKYKDKDNLAKFSKINKYLLEYEMKNDPSYKDIDKIDLTLAEHIRGSIKAELNSEFYMGDIDLLKNDDNLILRVIDYYDSFNNKYIFFGFLNGDGSVGHILYEKKTINGNIYFSYIDDEKILIDAYDNII